MKSKLLTALALACLCPLLSATTTVSGSIKTLGTTVAKGSYVRFWLRGCKGNQPRVSGVAIFPANVNGQFYFDVPTDAAGTVAGTIYSTRAANGIDGGEIDCGGSHVATWYGMQVFRNSVGGPEVPVHAKDTGILDVSNVVPISTSAVTVAPTGDNTYLRLDGGNSPVIGTLSVNAPFNVTGPTQLANVTMNAATASNLTLSNSFHFSNPGTFTNTQMNQYVTSLVGGISPDMYRQQGFPEYTTEAGTFGLLVPANSPISEADGLVTMIETHCDSSNRARCNAVGNSTHARAMVTGAGVWGRNVTVGDVPGIGPAFFAGDEIDVGVTSDQSNGFVHGLDIVITASAPAVMPNVGPQGTALDIFKAGGTLGWPNGIYMGVAGVSGNGIWIDKSCATGACNSPPITLTGGDTGGSGSFSTQIRADRHGDLVVNSLGGTAGLTLPSFDYTTMNAAALPNGTTLFCNDCKNVPDNSVTAGAACVSGGQGARAIRENSRWDCN